METITRETVVPELGRTIPETLGRLGKACFDMYESEDLCRHVLARQQFVFDELMKRAPDESALRERDVLDKYVAQLSDFVAFLQRHSCMEQLSRLASSRTVSEEIHRFHMDVDSLLKLLGVGSDAEVLAWRQQMASDWKARCDLMKKQLDDTLLVGFELSSDSLMEALTELLYEMDEKTASNSPEHLALMRSTYETVVSMSKEVVPTVPKWFIPSYDVIWLDEEFGAGSFGRVYRGKWNGTQVVVKCLTDAGTRARSYFVNRFSSWTSIRHAHVLKIFGACHVSRPMFVVLEDATGRNFVDFFRDARNKRHMWRLFGEAALGLAHLHANNIRHGNLRCSNLLVGADGKARVSDYGFGFIRWESVSVSIKPQTEALRWKALEYFTGECSEANPQPKSDVYSFGMCIIEAMTGQVPWSGIDEDNIPEQLESKIFHPRPAGIFSDKEWELVTQLSAIDKAERIELSAAIDILKELADEEERADETKAEPPAIAQLDDAQVDQFHQPSPPHQTQQDPLSPSHELDVPETSTQVLDTQPKHQQKPASWVASLLQSAIKMRGMSADVSAEAGAGHAEVQVQLQLLERQRTQSDAVVKIERHLQRLCLETRENECLLERLVNDFVDLIKAAVSGSVTTIAIAATSDRDTAAAGGGGGAAIASGSFDAALSSDMMLCLDALYRELLTLLERCSTPANVFYRIASSRHVLFEIETLCDELCRLDRFVSPTAAAAVVDDSSDGGDGSNGDWVETWDELEAIRDAQLLSSLDATRALLEVLPDRASQQEALLMLRYERKAGSDANSLVALALAKVSRWFTTGRIDGGSDSRDDNTANDGSERVDAVNDDMEDGKYDDDDDDDVPVWFVPRYEVTFDTSKCEPDGTFGTVYHGTWRRRDQPNAVVAVKVLLMHGLGGARSHASFVRDADCWFRLLNAAPVSLASDSQPLTLDALKTEVAASATATTATEAALVTVSTELTAAPTPHNGLSHVLKLLGASHVGQQAFLVLEDAAYGSLLQYVSRETSSSMNAGEALSLTDDRDILTPTDRETPSSTTDRSSIVWQLLHQAALGLAHLHDKGVVHGHLRCSNILVASDGTAKLSDFGFDAVRSEVGAMRATDRLRALQWTAPELLLNVGGQPTCSSDVYAFGMCIIEAMTGDVPWSGIDEDIVSVQLESKIFHPRPAGVFSDKEWKLVTQLSAIDKAERIELSAAIAILKELADEEARANETKAAPPAIAQLDDAQGDQLDDAQGDQFQQPSQPPQAQRDPSSPPHELDVPETSTQVLDTQPKQHQQKPASWVASLLQSAVRARRNAQDSLLVDRDSALQRAVGSGHVACHDRTNVANADQTQVNNNEHERQRLEVLLVDRDNALQRAVEAGHVGDVEYLVQHGASMADMLDVAAEHGQLEVIKTLVRLGANLDAKSKDGMTALMLAAQFGHPKLAVELIRYGADADTKGKDGMTALMLAAQFGHPELAVELIRCGADADAKGKDGMTALMLAAQFGHPKLAAELIRYGADADAKDKDGMTALMLAAKQGHSHVVDALFQYTAFTDTNPSGEHVALFVAAAIGDGDQLRELVAKGVDIDFATRDGRTALFYAAECGQADAVLFLIDCGACVTIKSRARYLQSQRERETPLTLTGRAGHMQLFETLVRAGTPVNVRSAVNGETPLISIARVDHFPAVSLLIAHGNGTGVLCFEDVQDDEYPLLPGSLATMQTMCAAVTFEFEPACVHMMARLQLVCSALQQRANQQKARQQQQQYHQDSTAVPSPAGQTPTSEHADALVTFACIVFRACRLLFDIEKKDSALSRFIASRAIQRRIDDIDAELSNFARMHGLVLSGAVATVSSSQQVDDVSDNNPLQLQQQVQTRFEQALRSNSALDISYDKVNDATAMYETAVLLQHELVLRRRERSSHALASVVKEVLARFLRVNEVMTPRVPFWFIARDDLEYHSWNLVKTENKIERYAGKWHGTSVTIEASIFGSDTFEAAVSQWHALSHPNIVKLFGACHVGDPTLFVYESTSDELPLHEFLRASESNRALTYKLLYDAALGLQYLHRRGVAHGCLQSETILVGSDAVAKLSHVGGDRELFAIHDRYDVHWMAPELAQDISAPSSAAADIFAFGMCIWEAVTLDRPRDDIELDGVVLDRPAGMRDSEWELINLMCTFDPSKRVSIAHVVNQLKQFMFEHDQANSDANGNEATKLSAARLANLKSQRVDKHYFVELGRTIPKALSVIKMDCEELTDDEQWLSTRVVPALYFAFELLQEHEMTPVDAEVKAFVDVLGRLQQFVRTAWSDKAVYQQRRSRKVAEKHRLVYDELDRLLDMLLVPHEHAIRVWHLEVTSSIAGFAMPAGLGGGNAHGSFSEAITINHFDTSPAIYKKWTREGLVKTAASSSSTWRPNWYLSLRELVFSKADELGKGVSGAVYKGKWGDAQVVIKFMGYEDDFDTISTDLMLHEVRVWHRLNHSHVLKLYGACHVDKRYFVCEYASGGDLVDYLNKQQPANAQLKWQKLHEAALGLQYLHNMGIAHNDLKGANIMIGADGRAKLIDFGLSALLGEAEIQIAVTNIGAVNWRSPEYLAGGRPSFASDVYSFAMCIIEVVSGEVPWGKTTDPRAIKYQLRRGRTVPPLPASMTAKQCNLLEVMTKHEANERVNMTFVVNKLHEIASDERFGRGVKRSRVHSN